MASRAITGIGRRSETFGPPGAHGVLSLLALLSLALASLTAFRQATGATGADTAGTRQSQAVAAPVPSGPAPLAGPRLLGAEPTDPPGEFVTFGAALARAERAPAATQSDLGLGQFVARFAADAALEAQALEAQRQAQVRAQAPAPPTPVPSAALSASGGENQTGVEEQAQTESEAASEAESSADSGGGDFLAGMESEMIAAINAQRTSNGLSPLAASGALRSVARARSNDMVTNGYFGHAGGVVFDMLRAAGIAFTWAGENLSRNNYPDSQSVSVAVGDFMSSGSHRANILSPNYTSIGVGCQDDGGGMKYCTVVFVG